MTVAAIVLAAGSSSRLGRPKQGLRIGGMTLLERALKTASDVADHVVVVTAPRCPMPSGLLARVVVNERAAEGLGSSIRAGVAAAGDDARLLLMLVDQPLVTADHLRTLLAQDAAIAATGYAGIAGVPVAFAPEFRSALLGLAGDRGARVIIEAHRARVAVVPFEDAALDIDDEESFLRARRIAGEGSRRET